MRSSHSSLNAAYSRVGHQAGQFGPTYSAASEGQKAPHRTGQAAARRSIPHELPSEPPKLSLRRHARMSHPPRARHRRHARSSSPAEPSCLKESHTSGVAERGETPSGVTAAGGSRPRALSTHVGSALHESEKFPCASSFSRRSAPSFLVQTEALGTGRWAGTSIQHSLESLLFNPSTTAVPRSPSAPVCCQNHSRSTCYSFSSICLSRPLHTNQDKRLPLDQGSMDGN